jgi:hypothetical protein
LEVVFASKIYTLEINIVREKMTNDQIESCICSQETKSGLSLVSKKAYNTIAALIILCIYVVMTVPTAYAEDTEDATTDYAVVVSETGMEAASALATMVYFPAKAAFALGGGIAGGLTYAFTGGDEKATSKIWRASMEGDYMVKPGNLTGEVPINFVGQDE